MMMMMMMLNILDWIFLDVYFVDATQFRPRHVIVASMLMQHWCDYVWFTVCKGRWICASAKQHSTRSTWVWACWLLVFEWPKQVDDVLYFSFNWQKDLSFCIQLGWGFISKSRIRVHLDPDVHFLQFFKFVYLNDFIERGKKKDWSSKPAWHLNEYSLLTPCRFFEALEYARLKEQILSDNTLLRF